MYAFLLHSIILLDVLTSVAPAQFTTCLESDIYDPIDSTEGTYIVVGMFNIGKKKFRNVMIDGKVRNMTYCAHDAGKQYYMQKALLFREIMLEESKKLEQEFNVTVGYEIYDFCGSFAFTGRMAIRIAHDPRVIGVVAPDNKDYEVKAALITSSAFIPTHVYMYNDEQLLDTSKIPSVYSTSDTDETEGLITIQFLKAMEYQYMDIWYHKFSKNMADTIYGHVRTLKEGCGRMKEISYKEEIEDRFDGAYENTGGYGSASSVQLLLHNSHYTTMRMLKYMTENMTFRNKIYIFGPSVAREIYHQDYADFFNNIPDSNDTLVFLLPALLNTDLPRMNARLSTAWTGNRGVYMDDLYRAVQKANCWDKDYSTCKATSWLTSVSAGLQIFFHALRRMLLASAEAGVPDCPVGFRRELYAEIINDTVEIPLKFEEKEIVIQMQNKTLKLDYDIKVWTKSSNEFVHVGKIHDKKFEIQNQELLSSLKYPKTCSPRCSPGTHRHFDYMIELPCCWECDECHVHQYSTEENSDNCHSCKVSEESSEDKTMCLNVDTVHIPMNSPKFIGGVVLILVGLAVVFVLGYYIWSKEERPVIKASDPSFLYLFLANLALGMMTALIPLMKPSQSTCRAEYICCVCFATLVTSNLAWRCGKIYSVFQTAIENRKVTFPIIYTTKGQVITNIGCLSINIIIMAVSLVVGVAWNLEKYQMYHHKENYLRCAPDNTLLTFIPLLIPMMLSLVTLYLAFRMRKFPHNFRETTNIFMATLLVCLTVIMFLTGYNLSPPLIQPLLRSIVMYLTCVNFMACIFLPKVIILVKNVDSKVEKAELSADVKKFSKRVSEGKI